MAKESGLGMTISVDDSGGTARAIGPDITSVSWTMPSNVQDTTGITKSAYERILLLADFSLTLNGVFNDAANLSHTVFKNYRTLNGTDVGRTTAIAHSGQTLGVNGRTTDIYVLYTDYSLNRPQSGELTWTAPGQLAEGVVPEWS